MIRPVARIHGPHRRAGTALVEALLGAVLGGVVLAAALDLVVRTARNSREFDAHATARAGLEQAATALASDIRPITTTASGEDVADLRAVADTAIELAATVGGGIACAVAATPGPGSSVDLASAPQGAGAPTLAWWNAPPRTGDIAFVHDDAGTPTAGDDHWSVRTVRSVSEGTTFCRSGPLASAAAGAAPVDAPRLRIALDPPLLPATVGAGAPVRIARRRRYSLYRASDGWQLGVRDWDGADWEGIQPFAGPFDSPAAGGLVIEAADANGASVQGSPPPQPVTELRVRLHVACATRDRRLRCTDSTVAVVRPRGNA